MQDEGPSEDDIERFSEAMGAHCPKCGAMIYEDLDQCPSCGTYITGPVSRSPRERAARKRLATVIAIITLIGFLLLAGLGGLLRIF